MVPQIFSLQLRRACRRHGRGGATARTSFWMGTYSYDDASGVRTTFAHGGMSLNMAEAA